MAHRALVIGVGRYGDESDLRSYETITASAKRYEALLSRPSFMGQDGCRILTEDELTSRDAILGAVEQVAMETERGDRLMVVYVGHGRRWLDAGNQQVHFATARSREGNVWTWVSGADIYEILHRAKAELKVLIADCCYSNFLSPLGDTRDAEVQLGVLGEEHKGTCVLAAVNGEGPTGREAFAEGCPHLPEGLSGCTTFSGHLLALLENATDSEVADIPLGGLRDQLIDQMKTCRTLHPVPQMLLNRGATDSTPIFPRPRSEEGETAPTRPLSADAWVDALLADPEMLPTLMRDPRMAGKVSARLLQRRGNALSSLRQHIEKRANSDYDADTFFQYLSGFFQYRSGTGTGISAAARESASDTVARGTGDSANLQWVMYVEPREFVARLRVMREGLGGIPPMPTQAMLAIRDFAIHRPVRDLLALAAHAPGDDDVLQVVATAALRRTPREAADLVAGLLRIKAGAGDDDPPTAPEVDHLVRNVLNDIAGQRTALDIAEFLRECRDHANLGEAAADWLVTWTLDRFTSADSGRIQKDKARLYVVLHEMRYAKEADQVIRGTLTGLEPGEHRPLADASRTVEFAQALRTLSPTQPLLVNWLAAHLQDNRKFSTYRRLIAQLLHSDPLGRRHLVTDVMSLNADDVVPIFRLLCGEEAEPHVFGVVQRLTATLLSTDRLATLVERWARDPVLRPRTQGFLRDVVAGGNRGPRTREELQDLALELGRVNAGDEWVQTLWREAAAYVKGRRGDDLVWLLQQVRRPGHRHVTEQKIALGLAEALLTRTEPPERFVEYIRALKHARDYDAKTAVFLACKELADPEGAARPYRMPVEVLAKTAHLLAEARQVGEAMDVLERYMEDEHHTTAEDMCALVRGLTGDGFPHDKLNALLQNTLGRWSDAGKRRGTVDALVTDLRTQTGVEDVLGVVTALGY